MCWPKTHRLLPRYQTKCISCQDTHICLPFHETVTRRSTPIMFLEQAPHKWSILVLQDLVHNNHTPICKNFDCLLSFHATFPLFPYFLTFFKRLFILILERIPYSKRAPFIPNPSDWETKHTFFFQFRQVFVSLFLPSIYTQLHVDLCCKICSGVIN